MIEIQTISISAQTIRGVYLLSITNRAVSRLRSGWFSSLKFQATFLLKVSLGCNSGCSFNNEEFQSLKSVLHSLKGLTKIPSIGLLFFLVVRSGNVLRVLQEKKQHAKLMQLILVLHSGES